MASQAHDGVGSTLPADRWEAEPGPGQTAWDRLIVAARELLDDRGSTKIASRAVADLADSSDLASHKHFDDLSDLLVSTFLEELLVLSRSVSTSAHCVGGRTVADVLHDVDEAAMGFYGRVVPMVCGLFTRPDLLKMFGRRLCETTYGLSGLVSALGAYLYAEQLLGAVRDDVDPEAFALIFLENSFQRVLRGHFVDTVAPADEAFGDESVNFLISTVIAEVE
ncbi:hypothetical protein [Nocardia colli]|uniref:hypothetical protein n=1 Tax=Nocardia colli TaxID=2545717 RepID=UPI0035DAC600